MQGWVFKGKMSQWRLRGELETQVAEVRNYKRLVSVNPAPSCVG